MGFDTATTLQRLTAPISAVSSLMMAIGYATPNWLTVGEFAHAGLWQSCSDDICTFQTAEAGRGYLQTTRVLESLGLVGLVTTSVLCVLMLLNDGMRTSTNEILAVIVGLLSKVFIVTGLVVFGVEFTSPGIINVGYSMILAIIAAVLSTTVTVLIRINRRRRLMFARFA